MKKDKFLLRLVAAPFVYMVIAIAFNYEAFRRLWKYILYGGEWLSYEKKDQVTMQQIFDELKKTTNGN